MLSQKAKYAIKARVVSEQHNIPKKFLDLILFELRQRNLIHSTRGRDGGYALARPAAQITIAEIVRAVDGPLAPPALRQREILSPLRDEQDHAPGPRCRRRNPGQYLAGGSGRANPAPQGHRLKGRSASGLLIGTRSQKHAARPRFHTRQNCTRHSTSLSVVVTKSTVTRFPSVLRSPTRPPDSFTDLALNLAGTYRRS